MKYLSINDLNKEYIKLQKMYGDPNLDSVMNGGCLNNPNVFFIFMNPTKRNIASSKSWEGLKAPWIGTKNIWSLFYELDLVDEEIFSEIRNIKGKDWTHEFAEKVYENVIRKKYFLTNLAKCTQSDARSLPDEIFMNYLDLLLKEIEIVKPKKVIMFGNQVSSIILNTKITVSSVRKQKFVKNIGGTDYDFYPVYYPIGNGRFNIDKAIDDIKWIMNS